MNCRATWSELLDQADVNQQPVEAARLCAIRAQIELALAAAENALLLDEGGIERHAGRLQHHQRQIGCVKAAHGGGQIRRLKIQRVDSVVSGEVARVGGVDAAADRDIVESRLNDVL